MMEHLRMARSKEMDDWEPELRELIHALTLCQYHGIRIVSAVLAIWIMVSITGCGLHVEGRICFVWYL